MNAFEEQLREKAMNALRRKPGKVLADTLARAREITGTATSPDGSIRVTVDSTGMLTQLDLGTSRLDNASLTRQITAAVQRAAARARSEVRNLYATLVDSRIIDELPEWLPDAPHIAAVPEIRKEVVEDEREPRLSEDAW
ncbi:MAG TPA: YbaB/EbfC family nucleoid-associated protein [Lentzea sp.]